MSIPTLTIVVTILVAIFVALMTRQLKISEFRQAWIEGIRKDTSEYISKAHEWIELCISLNLESDQVIKSGVVDKLDQIKYDAFHVLWRIELRFKPDDKSANSLLFNLRELLNPAILDSNNKYSSWRDAADKAVLETRVLLKKEWEVTKKPLNKSSENT
jgi:hypothetical protein